MRSPSFLTLVSAIVAIVTLFSNVQGAQQPLDLGLAEPYAILAGSAVTSAGTVGTVVNGDIGVSPGSAVDGFPPAIINGAINAANGAAEGAKSSLTTAYGVLVAKPFNTTLTSQDLGGMTLLPGVYRFDGGATMNGMLTLDAAGNAAAVWVFQISSTLLVAQGSSVIFKDSIGNPDYVYWQVGSSATLATGVAMVGNILAFASITMNYGSTLEGRCLARNAAVTVDKATITKPTIVSFRATQTIFGISEEQYNVNPVLNSDTLKSAIAKVMTGTSPANIIEFVMSAGPTSAASMISFAGFTTKKHVQATSSVIINYVVLVPSTKTVEELQAQLKAAVEDGTFNTVLQATATDTGATDLQGATSETIETETIDLDDTGDSNKKSLSDGAIAGIVIGCFFGVVLIAALIFFFACHHGAASAGSTHKSTGVTTQEV